MHFSLNTHLPDLICTTRAASHTIFNRFQFIRNVSARHKWFRSASFARLSLNFAWQAHVRIVYVCACMHTPLPGEILLMDRSNFQRWLQPHCMWFPLVLSVLSVSLFFFCSQNEGSTVYHQHGPFIWSNRCAVIETFIEMKGIIVVNVLTGAWHLDGM